MHVINRVARHCYLLGDDLVSGKNFDHRKVWIKNRLQQLPAAFGIDLLAFSCLSNHFYLILRSRPDLVATWDDTEVSRGCFLAPLAIDERQDRLSACPHQPGHRCRDKGFPQISLGD